MEFVEVVRDRRRIAQALMRDDVLEPQIRRRRRGDGLAPGAAPCAHADLVRAFAYRNARDEHWPISFCDDCLTIVAGRDPLGRVGRRPRWKYDERNVAAVRWARQWPKPGRPRTRTPPSEVAWPDAA